MKQDVHVILGSADSEHADVMVLANSSEVSPQARLQVLCDRLAAILGAKDHVDVISREVWAICRPFRCPACARRILGTG